MSKHYRKARSKNRRAKPIGAVFSCPNRRVLETIRKLSLKKGERSEKIVRGALELMTDRQEIIGFWKAFKKDDRKGIDYFVRISAGEQRTEIVRLQIKSSRTGARNHQDKAREVGVFGTDFYSRIIIVFPGEKPEDIIPKIKKAIERYLKKLS